MSDNDESKPAGQTPQLPAEQAAPASAGETAPTIVGVDTGGTFTDIVIRHPDGRLDVRKLPSTPDDPSQSVLAGVRECQGEGWFAADYQVVHGTTVATNALLQRRGVSTALLTTVGFRDLLAIGRQARAHLYTFTPSKPAPLLPSSQCFELTERLDAQGNILTPLDAAQAEALLNELKAQGIQSLAVCFLYSYLNPVHERMVERMARARGFDVSLSCDIAPEPREFERASTTAANAFVAPLMRTYLGNLQTQLTGLHALRLRVMQSNGGALSAGEAAQRAISTALSGPAGGVVAAARIGVEAGFPDLLTFDMGGTSTDVALVLGGQCAVVTSGLLGDLPLRAPLLDIHTVGAGGGSLARLDSAGGLRVGPQSAGAEPGPVAYGRGETLTVTDANVLLGRLPHDTLLAGRVPLDVARVRAHFDVLARSLHLAPEQAALGIVAVANAAMARALRHVSVERGHDPARLALLSFGGSGGLHACELAEALDMRTVVIPRYPGAFSALGLAFADVRREYMQALPSLRVPAPDAAGDGRVKQCADANSLKEETLSTVRMLNGILTKLRVSADEDRIQEGFTLASWREQAFLDMRYIGQSFELRVPWFPAPSNDAAFPPPIPIAQDAPAVFAFSPQVLRGAEQAFRALHLQRFGYADSEEPVEITGVRLIAAGNSRGEELKTASPAALPNTDAVHAGSPRSIQSASAVEGGDADAAAETRPVYLAGGWQDVPLYQRAMLRSGAAFPGPALAAQRDATTYIAPGWQAAVDVNGNIILRR